MRLKNLYIKEYKNLKDFSLDFSIGNGFTMIIGNNGSGKSNVLEVISAIFFDVYRKDNLKIRKDYTLEFSINNGSAVIIKRKNDRRTFFYNGRVVNQQFWSATIKMQSKNTLV